MMRIQRPLGRRGFAPCGHSRSAKRVDPGGYRSLWRADSGGASTGTNRNDQLYEVCQTLDEIGCPVVVIKSLDHLPDIGADLDLLTCANEERVIQVMRERFNITIEPRSWSDRVATS